VRFGGPDAAEAWYWGASPLWGEPPPADGVGLVGVYASQIGFGSTASADPVMLDPSGLGAFVARYGGDGELVLAERIVCQQRCSPSRPWAVAETGAFLMSGTFDVKVTLGPDGPTETELVNSSLGNADYFLALYRGDGQLVWARREGGPYFDYATLWPIDDESFAVVGHFGTPGPFGGTTIVGTGDPNQTELQSAGDFDVLLAKYAAK
jgi:hypothetical protein